MMKEFYDDDEKEVLKAPYYIVFYIDDYGYKHVATIKDESYLHYIRDRFIVVETKFIAE